MTACLLANVLAVIGAAVLCLALVILAAALIVVAVNKADGAIDDLISRWRDNIDAGRDL